MASFYRMGYWLQIWNKIKRISYEENIIILEEDGKAEAGCHFCNKKYVFTKEELIEIRDKYGDDRRTEIDYTAGDFNAEELTKNLWQERQDYACNYAAPLRIVWIKNATEQESNRYNYDRDLKG